MTLEAVQVEGHRAWYRTFASAGSELRDFGSAQAVLTTLRPELGGAEARVLAHAAFGLMNSTPFLSGEVDRGRCADLLRAATLAALLSPNHS